MELDKRKNLPKAFFGNGDFKTQKFFVEMEQHKFPICHPLLYCALKILIHSMQRLGCGEI
jgi:hypothetical protein